MSPWLRAEVGRPIPAQPRTAPPDGRALRCIRAASIPAGPPPTITTFLIGPAVGVTVCGMLASRVVATLWTQNASNPSDDPIDAITGADAGANLFLFPGFQLVDMMGVGQKGARHPDHVDRARLQRVHRGGGVRHPGRMEYSDLVGDLVADRLCERQIRRRWDPHRRPYLRFALIVDGIAADDADEIDQSAAGVASSRLCTQSSGLSPPFSISAPGMRMPTT